MIATAAEPLAAFFAALSSRLGGDPEPLPEDAIARLVDLARAGDGEGRRALYAQFVSQCFVPPAACCRRTPTPRT